MQIRLILAVVLLVLVTGLGIFLYVTRPVTNPDGEVTRLTDLQSSDINRITIVQTTERSIRFIRQGGKWYMQEPYQLAANPLRIQGILGLAGAYSYTQLDAGTLDLQRLQLEPPNLKIFLNDIEFRFGDASPLGKQRYVLHDRTVHLVNDSLYLQLQAPATFFLETRLLPADAEILAIRYTDYSIARTDSGWQIIPPMENGQGDIDAIIAAWQSAEALSVRDYEMDQGMGSVVLELQDHPKITYDIAITDSGMILGRRDLQLQYHLSRYDYDQMFIDTTPGITAPPVE